MTSSIRIHKAKQSATSIKAATAAAAVGSLVIAPSNDATKWSAAIEAGSISLLRADLSQRNQTDLSALQLSRTPVEIPFSEADERRFDKLAIRHALGEISELELQEFAALSSRRSRPQNDFEVNQVIEMRRHSAFLRRVLEARHELFGSV